MARQARASSSGGSDSTRKFLVGVARAFGGAIYFSLPLMMTMEMWRLGFYMDPLRLALVMVLMLPLLTDLTRFAGFRQTSGWREDMVDALTAYGVGFVASAVVLALFNLLNPSMPLHEIVGKTALQAVPASFGAVLATAQLGGKQQSNGGGGYGTEIFLMAAGAVFLAFNVAPTEEMILIAFKMTRWHAVALVAASVVMMHAFVYAVSFAGQEPTPAGTSGWSIFLRFTLVGYAVCLAISAYILWTFGRFDSAAYGPMVMETVVMAFPASLGAAAARLIL